jgi:hypothetical protein
MHAVLIELMMLSLAVASGGFYFRDVLAERPKAEFLAGAVVLVLVLVLQGLFEVYGVAAKSVREFSESYQRYTEIERQNADVALNVRLQQELARGKCYSGPLDGIWGKQSSGALFDFIRAVGKEEQFGDSVPVSDLDKLFAEAPDGVCTRYQASAMKRYKIAFNSVVQKCTDYLLIFPVESQSQECENLRNERDRLARRLEALGVTPPEK